MIEFIYFDVGGVLVFDFSKNNKWDQMTNDMGIALADRDRFHEFYMDQNHDICRGKINIESLVPEINKRFDTNLDSKYSFLSDFVTRFEANKELQSAAIELSRDYKIGLLTNMYIDMLNLISTQGKLDLVYYPTVVDSSVLGQAKPDQDIYITCEQRAAVKPDEILFIDNVEENLTVPKERGWKTLLYDPSDAAGSNQRLFKLLENDRTQAT